MSRKNLFPIALFAFGQSVFAADLPSAGGQVQQIPPAPSPQRNAPPIHIQQGDAAVMSASDNVKIVVNTLNVTGQTLYSEAELIAITGFRPGELTLGEMRAMATKIADFYHRQGYFVAQAYLPAQDIKNETVTIAVLEGHYGKVTLNNQSRLKDSLANGLLNGLETGDTIAIGPLENRLLLLSDVPGVIVRSTLVPGETVGTSDLLVDLTPGRSVSGSVEADN